MLLLLPLAPYGVVRTRLALYILSWLVQGLCSLPFVACYKARAKLETGLCLCLCLPLLLSPLLFICFSNVLELLVLVLSKY
jgi:hypothetical protein